MEIRIAVCFIALVIGFIIILLISDNYYKSHSAVSLSFSSAQIPSVLKFVFAVGDNKSNSRSDNITNAKLPDEFINKVITVVGTREKAIELLDKRFGATRNNTHAMIGKALALSILGKPQDAVTWYDKVLTIDRNNTHAMIGKALGLGILGKYHDSIALFDKVLTIDRNNTHAMIGKGVGLAILGKYHDAIALFDKVLAIDKNNTHAMIAAMIDKGNALVRLGKHQDAIALFDKVLTVDRNDTVAMVDKGRALDELGKHQEAISWFDKALNQKHLTGSDIDIDTIDTVSNKAFVLATELNEYDKALSLTEEYLKKRPEHKGLLCATVRIYNETGYEGIANQFKEQLTKLDPHYKCGLIAKVSEIEKEAFA
jgi:tetratricopeptide (TPR) repeat protein